MVIIRRYTQCSGKIGDNIASYFIGEAPQTFQCVEGRMFPSGGTTTLSQCTYDYEEQTVKWSTEVNCSQRKHFPILYRLNKSTTFDAHNFYYAKQLNGTEVHANKLR